MIQASGIRYLSNKIFKFLKNNKGQWDKVSFQQNLQILKNNKYQLGTLSFQQDLQVLKKYLMSVGNRIFPTESLNSLEIIKVRRIRYLSKTIFKFLKYNKFQYYKVSFQRDLQFLEK